MLMILDMVQSLPGNAGRVPVKPNGDLFLSTNAVNYRNVILHTHTLHSSRSNVLRVNLQVSMYLCRMFV